MKKALKRILTFALVLCLTVIGVVTVPMVSANAEEQTATLSFANQAQRTTFNSNQQIWEQNGVTFTNDKASSTSNVANYVNPARLYASSKVTVEHESNQITKILFDCNSNSYATALKNSIGTDSGATTTVSSDKVTVAFSEAKESFVIAKLTAQVRIDSLTVTYTEAAEGETPAPILKLTGNDYVQIGDDLALTATTENFGEGLEVVWESDNKDVALVDEDGIVTGVSMGTANITVTASDNAGNEESKTMAVKVYPANSNPITIAEALAICQFTGTSETPYSYTTAGTIEGTPTIYNANNNQYTVTITDGTNKIMVYAVKAENGKTLLEGMSITVSASLKTYNNTPEFVYGSCVINQTDAQEAMQEALNAINAYMSLSYKYTQTTEMQEVAAEVTDTLNKALTGATGNSYIDWSGKKVISDAVYAGNSAGNNSSIQLRSDKSNAGVITTVSGGKAKKVILSWHSATTEGRTVDIYGKNTAYTSPTELYKTNTQGTKLGSLKKGETELEITGDYEYIAFRSNSGALYLSSVQITWATGAGEGMEEVTVMKDSDFRIRCGVDASLLEIAGEYNFGIQVSANGKTVEYTTTATSWTEENGMVYVVISLGDIINDLTKLNTKFTVTAFVEVDGVILTSTVSKNMSVVDMVAYYLDNEDIKEVTHLYDYLANAGLI